MLTLSEFEDQFPEYAFDFRHRLGDQQRLYADDSQLVSLPHELIPISPSRAIGAPGPGPAPLRNQTRTHCQCAMCKRLFRNDYFVAGPKLRELNKIYSYCKTCRSANTRRYSKSKTAMHREQRRKRIAYEVGKLITPHCVQCGFDKHPAAIELHHMDKKSKDAQIALLVASFTKGRNRMFAEEIRKEADKCLPLCANCHRLVHYGIIQLEVDYPAPPWTADDLMAIADRLWKSHHQSDTDTDME